jgi:hypothetical protein
MGSKAAPFAHFVAPLRDLIAWFGAEGVPGVVIGGVAAGLLGRPRATQHLDAVVLLAPERWAAFLEAGTRFGFGPRVSEALNFARQARVLLVRHGASAVDADVTFAGLPFEEEVVASAKPVEVGGVLVPLPTPEDLIVMKAFAHRPRDMADIESLLDSHPKLDLRRVRRWVREFAATVDAPELATDLEALIAAKRKRKRKKKP